MTGIHHMTTRQAEKNNIAISVDGRNDVYTMTDKTDAKFTASGRDPKVVLATVLEMRTRAGKSAKRQDDQNDAEAEMLAVFHPTLIDAARALPRLVKLAKRTVDVITKDDKYRVILTGDEMPRGWTMVSEEDLRDALVEAAKKPAKAAKAAKPPKAVKAKKAKRRASEDGEEDEDGEDGDEGDEESHSVVKPAYKVKYKPFQAKCGDDLSTHLTATVCDADGRVDQVKLANVGNANGIDVSRWNHLNGGMRRMNMANVLRGMIRQGNDVVIGGRTFKGDKLEAKTAKTPKAKAKAATKTPRAKKAKKTPAVH